MNRDLLGRPLPEHVQQTELQLPGADVIERQPVRIASELPMDPRTIPLDLEECRHVLILPIEGMRSLACAECFKLFPPPVRP